MQITPSSSLPSQRLEDVVNVTSKPEWRKCCQPKDWRCYLLQKLFRWHVCAVYIKHRNRQSQRNDKHFPQNIFFSLEAIRSFQSCQQSIKHSVRKSFMCINFHRSWGAYIIFRYSSSHIAFMCCIHSCDSW